MFSLDFPNSLMCRDFLDSFRSDPTVWIDPQTEEQVTPTAHRDASMSVRQSRRVIGILWSKVKEHLACTGKLTTEQQKRDFVVGNGRRGLMFLQSADDAWELFRVGLPDINMSVHVERLPGLVHWGISEDDAGKLIDSAITAADLVAPVSR